MLRSLLGTALLAVACRHAAEKPDAVAELGPELTRELNALEGLCAQTNADGDCVAEHNQICDALWSTAHACFEASKNAPACPEFVARIDRAVVARGFAGAAETHIVNLCEAACEARASGREWDDVQVVLSATCE